MKNLNFENISQYSVSYSRQYLVYLSFFSDCMVFKPIFKLIFIQNFFVLSSGLKLKTIFRESSQKKTQKKIFKFFKKKFISHKINGVGYDRYLHKIINILIGINFCSLNHLRRLTHSFSHPLSVQK